MKGKHKMYCGLCQKEVPDWILHAQSEEHQKNLSDPKIVNKAYQDHFEEVYGKIEKEGD